MIRIQNTGWRFVTAYRDGTTKAYTPHGTVHEIQTDALLSSVAITNMFSEMVNALSTPHPTSAQVINTTMYTDPVRVLDGETVEQAIARARSVSTQAQQFDRACAAEQIDPAVAKRLRERLFGREVV